MKASKPKYNIIIRKKKLNIKFQFGICFAFACKLLYYNNLQFIFFLKNPHSIIDRERKIRIQQNANQFPKSINQ